MSLSERLKLGRRLISFDDYDENDILPPIQENYDGFKKVEEEAKTMHENLIFGNTVKELPVLYTWKYKIVKERLTPSATTIPTCYMCKLKIGQDEKNNPPKPGLGLCKSCEEINANHRNDKTDLTGKFAIVTGARIKIGFSVVLRFLRRGATVIAITRFPKDAVRRYSAEKDFNKWSKRLHIYGIDLRQYATVSSFIQHIKKYYPRLDILVNNAAQTVRRPPIYYKELFEKEGEPLDPKHQYLIKDISHDPWVVSRQSDKTKKSLTITKNVTESAALSQLALLPQDSLYDPSLFPIGQHDAYGEQLDLRKETSWNSTVDEISPIEMVEVQLVNSIIPFLLVSQLLPHMTKPSFIVNVTSQEGQFSTIKSGEHVHTNMAKASLNMLTKTISADLCLKNIYVTSVDTGWVSRTRPGPDTEKTIPAPLTMEDGAARVTHPVLEGLASGHYHQGVLLKDFKVSPW
jgi:NAD(P)-dependent dehydrogenase (short-subunit alcohol dehydrogenase family)